MVRGRQEGKELSGQDDCVIISLSKRGCVRGVVATSRAEPAFILVQNPGQDYPLGCPHTDPRRGHSDLLGQSAQAEMKLGVFIQTNEES